MVTTQTLFMDVIHTGSLALENKVKKFENFGSEICYILPDSLSNKARLL